MSAITDLLQQIPDKALRGRLEQEVARMSKRKKFGLIFEEHIPECTPLYDVKIRIGSTVALKTGKINNFYTVIKITGTTATCFQKSTKTTTSFELSELVTIAQFGEPIYPTLKPIDVVENAPDSSLWHTLIEADNFHGLQLLEYLYHDKVDCIYIDPPYNTGAKDWKYNNNYVDKNDAYKHSKWLAMMEKRLKLAKRLLNPENSVLIVAIDENELHHLALLLGQIFIGDKIQMVSVVSNFAGASIIDQFTRVDEQLLFVNIGNARPIKTYTDTTPGISSVVDENGKTKKFQWEKFLRSGGNSRRQDTKAKFFPVFINEKLHKIVGCGDHLLLGLPIQESPLKPKNCIEQWPISQAGNEACWQLSAPTFRKYLEDGRIKLGKKNKKTGRYGISFLTKGHMAAIERGELTIEGRDDQGSLIVKNVEGLHLAKKGKTIWTNPAYFGREHGSILLNSILLNRKFPFPKSIYSVEDALRFYVGNKPSALIVDFFAGSGTTLHAVNLLNKEDNGNRRCILVTNNEVSEDEAKVLTKKGYKPGDEEWEKLGTARYITWPRTVCSIKGENIDGEKLEGNYISNNISMAEGFSSNCEYFKLGFLDKNKVAMGKQFKEILPLLWLKTGAVGERPKLKGSKIPDMLIFPKNKFAILTKESSFMQFQEKLSEHPEIETVFIVTDSERAYREMISGLNVKETYQLYRDYLDNFRINARR